MGIRLEAAADVTPIGSTGRQVFQFSIGSTLRQLARWGVAPGNQLIRILRVADRPMMARSLMIRLHVERYDKRVLGLFRSAFLVRVPTLAIQSSLECLPSSAPS